jgi:methylated-DNA-[protein]-cysteine S-methyltransferase
MKSVPVSYTLMSSPAGELLLISDGEALTEVTVESDPRWREREGWVRRDDGVLRRACEQLQDYFAGRLTHFDLPLAPRGTAFQRQVWEGLNSVPFGETVSYGQLAERLGQARSARAVGAALGRNPIAIIVPCHRVVGSNGSLTGYAGGLDLKRWLLDHERNARPE